MNARKMSPTMTEVKKNSGTFTICTFSTTSPTDTVIACKTLTTDISMKRPMKPWRIVMPGTPSSSASVRRMMTHARPPIHIVSDVNSAAMAEPYVSTGYSFSVSIFVGDDMKSEILPESRSIASMMLCHVVEFASSPTSVAAVSRSVLRVPSASFVVVSTDCICVSVASSWSRIVFICAISRDCDVARADMELSAELRVEKLELMLGRVVPVSWDRMASSDVTALVVSFDRLVTRAVVSFIVLVASCCICLRASSWLWVLSCSDCSREIWSLTDERDAKGELDSVSMRDCWASARLCAVSMPVDICPFMRAYVPLADCIVSEAVPAAVVMELDAVSSGAASPRANDESDSRVESAVETMEDTCVLRSFASSLSCPMVVRAVAILPCWESMSLERSVSFPWAVSTLPTAARSAAVAVASASLSLELACANALLNLSDTTLATVATNVSLICSSTVVAPVSVTRGAMALTFSLT